MIELVMTLETIKVFFSRNFTIIILGFVCNKDVLMNASDHQIHLDVIWDLLPFINDSAYFSLITGFEKHLLF